MMRIILTGTPGTGKTSIGNELAKALKCEIIHVNELLKKGRLYSKKEGGEHVADLPKLRKALLAILKTKENIILESHLLCDLRLPADIVIVMRCDPKELDRRLRKRKYAKIKINENLLSEILDYCLINALENYMKGRVMQVDATGRISAKSLIAEIRKFQKTGRAREFRWLKKMGARELLKLGA
jgi:adenylate kinase